MTKKSKKKNSSARGTTNRAKRRNQKHIQVNQSLSKEETKILDTLRNMRETEVASRALMAASGLKSKTAFYQALHHLERKGRISVNAKHKVRYLPDSDDIDAEIVSLTPGFAFAKPTSGGEDFFIHGSNLKGAFLGDHVLLTDMRKEEKGLRARVKRITARSKNELTGTFRQANSAQAQIHPDGKLNYPFIVKIKDSKGARDGDKVSFTAKQNRFGEWDEAVVQHIFGSGESARVCADAILSRYGIPTVFPPEVSAQAEQAATLPISPQEYAQRFDLRTETIFTIDGADAKDLDDAISVKKTSGGGYRLGVHIADVSHYVKKGSPLDNEAFSRGTSVYFADRVIPMLPESLSNGACSLNAGEDKLAFSARITFNREGQMTKFDFVKTVIRSKVRGVYAEVNAIFDGSATPDLIKKYKPVQKALQNARELASLLRQAAAERGQMDLESDELRFVINEDGKCRDIVPRVTGEAEKLIEQLMIAANIAAAKYAQQNHLPFLYRVHEKPQPDRVNELCEVLGRLGVNDRTLKSGSPTTADFRTVLEQVKQTPLEYPVSQRILRTMEKARYAPEKLGHFGLNLEDYSHFTSPIRRYPDLAIHRILTECVYGIPHEKLVKKYAAFTDEAAQTSSAHEVRAVTAERAAEDCYAAEYMQQFIGDRFDGMISGVTAKGIFVRIPNGIEGYISTTDFQSANFAYDGLISLRDALSGRQLTIGDSIQILVAASDIASGRIDFMPAEA